MAISKILWMILKSDLYKSYLNQKKIREMPLDYIQKIQWKRLKELLEYSYKNSSFYHDLFKSVNLTPKDIVYYKDFSKLPFTSKKILKNNFNNVKVIGKDEKDYIVSYTSGSTGEPFSFLIDKQQESINTLAAFMLNKKHAGINPFEKNNEIMIKFEPVNEVSDLINTTTTGIYNRVKNLFISEIYGVNSLKINKNNTKEIYDFINFNNISGIYGYSSNVFSLAKHLREFDKEQHLKYVILIAEGILSQQKEFISNTFHCPVFMDYGASECMRMGFECKKCGGYHIDLYNYYFEFLDKNEEPCSAKESADIVVTNLNNYVFPLIRYKIGDQCIIGDEKNGHCENNYPVVSEIIGRRSEIIHLNNDKEIPLLSFDLFFEYLYQSIMQYQLIFYEDEKRLIVKIIPQDTPKKINLEKIKDEFLKLIGTNIKVTFEVVDSIPVGENGKTKSLIIK